MYVVSREVPGIGSVASLGPGVDRADVPGSSEAGVAALLVEAGGVADERAVNAFGWTSLAGLGVTLDVLGLGDSFALLRNSFCMFLTVFVCTGPNTPPMDFLRVIDGRRPVESVVGDVALVDFFLLSVLVLEAVDLALAF